MLRINEGIFGDWAKERKITRMRQRVWWRRRQGQALVIVALAMPLLIGMAGVGLTVGTVYYSQQKLQNAVDAGALAGAKALMMGDPNAPGDQAALVSQDDPGASHVKLTVSSSRPNTVEVSAMVQAPGTFAALFGHSHFAVHVNAAATYGPGAPFTYAVFQGDPHAGDPPLTLIGNTAVISSNGSPTANVHSNNDLKLQGNISVDGACEGDPSVIKEGSTSTEDSGSTGDSTSKEDSASKKESPDCAGPIVAPANQIAMPQWSVAQATPPNAIVVGSPSNPVGMTIGKDGKDQTVNGNYVINGNLVINGNTTVTGHYLVRDGNIIVNGNAIITGSLVTFGGGIFMAGNVSQSGGGALAVAAFTSNGQVAESANTPAAHNPPDAGSIVVDGNVNVSSILYAPDGYVDLNGNEDVSGAVIGYRVNLKGNVDITYTPSQNAAVPVQQVSLIQ